MHAAMLDVGPDGRPEECSIRKLAEGEPPYLILDRDDGGAQFVLFAEDFPLDNETAANAVFEEYKKLRALLEAEGDIPGIEGAVSERLR